MSVHFRVLGTKGLTIFLINETPDVCSFQSIVSNFEFSSQFVITQLFKPAKD